MDKLQRIWGGCFLRGTKIQTLRGERQVESLKIGDVLPSVFGGYRAVRWLARYRRRGGELAAAQARDFSPVRVARSAFALEAPHTDLYLTQQHAIYLDGALVPVGRLVNGTTISLFPASDFDELEYFHVKLDAHDVILAEGALCESMRNFDLLADNAADYVRQPGSSLWNEESCVPFLPEGDHVDPGVRARSEWLDSP